jgi:hypothetical protein
MSLMRRLSHPHWFTQPNNTNTIPRTFWKKRLNCTFYYVSLNTRRMCLPLDCKLSVYTCRMTEHQCKKAADTWTTVQQGGWYSNNRVIRRLISEKQCKKAADTWTTVQQGCWYLNNSARRRLIPEQQCSKAGYTWTTVQQGGWYLTNSARRRLISEQQCNKAADIIGWLAAKQVLRMMTLTANLNGIFDKR